MCGLGTWELLVILGIVVLLFGAKRLPALATGLGGALRSFRKSATEPDELEEPKPDGADAAAPGATSPSAEESARAAKARADGTPPRDPRA